VSDLLLTTHTPVLGSGRSLRTYAIARALAADDGLDLAYVRFEGDEPDPAFTAIEGIRLHAVVPSRGARRLLAYGRARLAGVPAALARGVSPELAAAAARLAAAPGRGRIVADGPVAAAATSRLARRRPVIYNAHNFESGFRHELEPGGIGSREQLANFERRLLERAVESWMVSEADIAAARELAPGASLRYVPNVVDVAAIEPVHPDVTGERILFVANYAYAPNRDAVEFMLTDVMPRVWRELPEARLVLVGAGLDRPPSEDPRVESVGFVADLRDAYAHATCAVTPLRVGGGTPLKLIEALAYGLPVIATPRAVAGLSVQDGVHCLVAEGPDAFAAALVRVLRHGGGELGARGRALAAERYSIEALTGVLAKA
jgi:glycosyltransferase involved in cell wall biosynthesis